MLKQNPTVAVVLARLFKVDCLPSLQCWRRNDSSIAFNENDRRTVSVSVETVIVIVFVDTVIELVIAGAVTLIDSIRHRIID